MTWVWIYLGACAVAAVVGTTQVRTQRFLNRNACTEVTTYEAEEPSDGDVVSLFVCLIGLTMIFPPVGIWLLIQTFVNASKRGKVRVRHTETTTSRQ